MPWQPPEVITHHNTNVCVPFGRQMITPAHCFTGNSYVIENVYNCRHLPCEGASAELFSFCFIHQVEFPRVVMELGTTFSVCLLLLYHKSGSNSTGSVQRFSRQSHYCEVFWGKCLCSYRLPASQLSACIVCRNTVTVCVKVTVVVAPVLLY